MKSEELGGKLAVFWMARQNGMKSKQVKRGAVVMSIFRLLGQPWL